MKKTWKKRLRPIWAEGARAALSGQNFSMTPYPTPKHSDIGWDNGQSAMRSAWSQGYWWAMKNRVPLDLDERYKNMIAAKRFEQQHESRLF